MRCWERLRAAATRLQAAAAVLSTLGAAGARVRMASGCGPAGCAAARWMRTLPTMQARGARGARRGGAPSTGARALQQRACGAAEAPPAAHHRGCRGLGGLLELQNRAEGAMVSGRGRAGAERLRTRRLRTCRRARPSAAPPWTRATPGC